LVDIPDKICDEAFDNTEIRRGTVIRVLSQFPDGSQRYKYFIAISRDIHIDPIIFVITTSNIDFYLKFPKFNNDAISIAAKTISFFQKDTVIDCRQIHQFSREILKQRFRENLLQFTGEMPKEFLDKIDQVIRQSKLLPKNQKKLILGEDF
jgi:hypothetical protein